MKNLYSTDPSVSAALGDFRRTFWSVAAFSAVVNILMFAGPLYMMQVYDRVLSGRSIPTLVGLTIVLVGVLTFQALVELIRSRIVVRAAGLLDRRLAGPVHRAVMQLAMWRGQAGEARQPVRDLDQIRSFLASTGPLAIVDLPWVPVFLVMCALIHYRTWNSGNYRSLIADWGHVSYRAGEPRSFAQAHGGGRREVSNAGGRSPQ